MRQRPFIWEGTSITLFTVLKCCIEGISGSSNRSFEHVIRAELLHDYDKTVTPILGQKPLTVLFEMKIVRLLKVVSTVQPYSLHDMLKFWLRFMRLNSQHCWANNVESCCVSVGSGVQTDATTPNNVGTCSASWEGYNPKDFGNRV